MLNFLMFSLYNTDCTSLFKQQLFFKASYIKDTVYETLEYFFLNKEVFFNEKIDTSIKAIYCTCSKMLSGECSSDFIQFLQDFFLPNIAVSDKEEF